MRIPDFRCQVSHLLFVVVLLAFLKPGVSLSSGWQWIEGTSVRNILEEGGGLWLIDIRGSNAYSSQHIEGSVNIPVDSLKYKKFPSNKRLVLVDDSLGQRMARDAADMLTKNGYTSVHVLDGGINSWKADGYPIVGKISVVKSVSADELRWAIENGVPLKIYDMRDSRAEVKEKIQGSEPVPGNNIREKIEKLKGLLNKGEKKDILVRLKKLPTTILLFSAADDPAGLIEKTLHDTPADIRYLRGGYEAFLAKKDKQTNRTGNCPACSGIEMKE